MININNCFITCYNWLNAVLWLYIRVYARKIARKNTKDF